GSVLYRTTLTAALAVIALARPAAAGQVPIQASGHRVHLSVEKVPGGEHILNTVPDGESSLGDWVGDIDLVVKGAHVAGVMVLTCETGDTLSVASEQKWSPHVGEFGGTVGEFVVTDGTGRLRGASGGGTITAVYRDKKFVEVVVVLDGVIELP